MQAFRLARVFAVLSLWLAASAAWAQGADFWADWQTATTPHFRVHYRAEQRAQAEAVAKAAERVYPRVTQALQWQPRGRTEVVVYSEIDLANGFSTQLPFNMMGIFLAPPDEGQLLDNTPWLDLLLVHEFTHAVHLDKVRGVPKVLQNIFGNVAWFIPNIFAPSWTLEGIAVYMESDPATGRGRLQGPMFEAWLRAERAKGFMKISELNADGRSLPLAKQYLYGAYFYEFLARKYGADKPQAFIERYSGNIGFAPRLHSGPYDATGKMMDTLWDEFLADLAEQVDRRAAPVVAQPEAVGERLVGPLFDIPSVATLPNGDLLAVLDDGLGATKLSRIGADGVPQPVAGLTVAARVDVGYGGSVLVAQADLCKTFYLSYDLYRLEGSSLRQLTSCAHLRRATAVAGGIAALQLDAGRTQLVLLDNDGANPKTVYRAANGEELVDLASAPDGRRLAVVTRRAADWRIVEFDLAAPQAAPKLLVRRGSPLQGLRHGKGGLEFVAVDAGVPNVWRLEGGQLRRLTHAHTAVVAHGGSAADGSLASVVIADGGYTLRRLKQPAVLQSVAADSGAPAATAAAAATPEPAPLGEASPYRAWRTLYPRWWLPTFTSDRGLTTVGASTGGSDALFFHNYAATLLVETSQRELLGSFEYSLLGAHNLAVTRTLTPRVWRGDSGDEEIVSYDRETRAQWLSLVPWLRVERRVLFGVGAALSREERINAEPRSVTRDHDERIAAALFDFDTRNGNWYSEGPNRGLRATLLYETYRPFRNDAPAGNATRYDGHVLRADLRGFVPLGRNVLALRWTEARAKDRTEPFQLGGATDEHLQFGFTLNSRDIAFRGYRGDEPELQGRNARLASVELRTPFADIDRHGMSPPFGINRLSGAFFVEAGGAWNGSNGPDKWRRSVGFELLGELRLLYALGIQLRAGVAGGLDEPRSTRAYLSAGRSF